LSIPDWSFMVANSKCKKNTEIIKQQIHHILSFMHHLPLEINGKQLHDIKIYR